MFLTTQSSFMKPEELSELSPRSVAYLKFIYTHDGHARTGDLATAFGVDPSTTTRAVQELTKNGFLVHVPYRGVTLTPEGWKAAEFCIRRHRILSLLLTRHGLAGPAACREAARFESHVTPSVVDAICSSLGHPMVGFCGRISHEGCMIEMEDPPSPDQDPAARK